MIDNDLDRQILKARQDFKIETYGVSIGELVSSYERGEINISPEYQRLFRWSDKRKTDLIESLLLNIPIPSIFVYQNDDGTWEVVDGLQRLCTVFQFTGVLKDNNTTVPNLVLHKTKYLPELEDIVWNRNQNDKSCQNPVLSEGMKLTFRRAKLNFIIIDPSSKAGVKYEVFMRLNKGALIATPQELRNCSMVMSNITVYRWICTLANDRNFQDSVFITQKQMQEQFDKELVIKFFFLTQMDYDKTKDYGENLDDAAERILFENEITLDRMACKFKQVFEFINKVLGMKSFRKSGKGKFMDSLYESVVIGVTSNIEQFENTDEYYDALHLKIANLWNEVTFRNNTGSGSNAKTRIPRLREFSIDYFRIDVK